MEAPSYAEFAQYRFVRDGNGDVVTLPAQGIDEKILLTLDCERWGLTRLHIFEEAALRSDKLEAFQKELPEIADIRSDSVSRLISWGRDGEELFYADEMLDGEPLPAYLGRAGGVPFCIAGKWMLQLFELFESMKSLPFSFERLMTLNIQVIVDMRKEVRPVVSEFYGWTKAGAQVDEHPIEWYFAQIFCSLIAGIPVRTFSRYSLPRNFDELDEKVREAVLGALDDGGGAYGQLKAAVSDLAAQCEEKDEDATALPLMPVRELLRTGLTESYPNKAEFELTEEFGRHDEYYSVSSLIRGRMANIQLIPGPGSIPREGWFNQHHNATRRPGRGLLNQLQLNYLEDRDPVTLIGEERIDGVDLASLIAWHGPIEPGEVREFAKKISRAIEGLEKNVGSCPVWWLPPDNVFLVTGTPSISGVSNLIERKGAGVLNEFGLKLRLHQTIETLKRGVNLPSGVRRLARDSGKKFEEVRRSSVGLPLLFFLLTGERLRWSLPVRYGIGMTDEMVDLLERYRKQLNESPETCETSLFDDLEALFVDGGKQQPKKKVVADHSLTDVLEATLYQDAIDLESGSGLAVAEDKATAKAEKRRGKKENQGEKDSDLSAAAPGKKEAESAQSDAKSDADADADADTDTEETDAGAKKRGWWPWSSLWVLALVAAVIASRVGFELTGNHQPLTKVVPEDSLQFPRSDFESGHEVYLSSALDELERFLVTSDQPEALALVPEIQVLRDFSDSKPLIAWLEKAAGEGNREAMRLSGLIKWRKGSPGDEVKERFVAASALGDSEAGYLLALHSFCEDPERESPDEAVVTRLRASAETGNDSSCELLATWLIDSDPAEAFQFLQKASRRERPSAMYQLGLCYANGSGTEKSPRAAAEAFRSAAERGCLKAMVAWGRCLESGFGTDADFTEAGRWMKMAALHQNEAAQIWLQERDLDLAGIAPAQ